MVHAVCEALGESVETKLEQWMMAMEDRGLRIRRKTTTYLRGRSPI